MHLQCQIKLFTHTLPQCRLVSVTTTSFVLTVLPLSPPRPLHQPHLDAVPHPRLYPLLPPLVKPSSYPGLIQILLSGNGPIQVKRPLESTPEVNTPRRGMVIRHLLPTPTLSCHHLAMTIVIGLPDVRRWEIERWFLVWCHVKTYRHDISPWHMLVYRVSWIVCFSR